MNKQCPNCQRPKGSELAVDNGTYQWWKCFFCLYVQRIRVKDGYVMETIGKSIKIKRR